MNYDPNNIEDGVYTDMPIDVYHANKTHISASSIKESYKSIAHFKAYLDKKEKREIHFDFGNAFELSIQDPNIFNDNVAIFHDDERPQPDKTFAASANKQWKANFYTENKDKLIIPSSGNDSLDTLTLCKASLFKHPAAIALLENTEYQTSIFWTCPDTGVRLKTRPDFWKPSTTKRSAVITDLKTDKDSESDKHLRTIQDRLYPIQACIQIMGLRAAKLIDEGARFFWIVCSKSSPYNTEVYEFDTTDIEAVMQTVKFKLEEIKRARENGLYLSYEPSIDMGVKTISFPYWFKRKLGIVEQIES